MIYFLIKFDDLKQLTNEQDIITRLINRMKYGNIFGDHYGNLEMALAEIESGKKVTHWAWWAFPTTLKGGSEPKKATAVTEENAHLLLDKAPPIWKKLLESISSKVNDENYQTYFNSHLDRGRINYFVAFWAKVVLNEKYKDHWMRQVILKLYNNVSEINKFINNNKDRKSKLDILNKKNNKSCYQNYDIGTNGKILKTFIIGTTKLHLVSGNVINFRSDNGAIVNAANEPCLGGGGIDGQIHQAVNKKINIKGFSSFSNFIENKIKKENGIRCPTGDAKLLTHPENKNFGSLGVKHIINAVGPDFMIIRYLSDKIYYKKSLEQFKNLLSKTYYNSLEKAEEKKIINIAFSLISGGVYRGKYRDGQDIISIKEAIELGIIGIKKWLSDNNKSSIKNIIIYGWIGNEKEVEALNSIKNIDNL